MFWKKTLWPNWGIIPTLTGGTEENHDKSRVKWNLISWDTYYVTTSQKSNKIKGLSLFSPVSRGQMKWEVTLITSRSLLNLRQNQSKLTSGRNVHAANSCLHRVFGHTQLALAIDTQRWRKTKEGIKIEKGDINESELKKMKRGRLKEGKLDLDEEVERQRETRREGKRRKQGIKNGRYEERNEGNKPGSPV